MRSVGKNNFLLLSLSLSICSLIFFSNRNLNSWLKLKAVVYQLKLLNVFNLNYGYLITINGIEMFHSGVVLYPPASGPTIFLEIAQNVFLFKYVITAFIFL